MPPSTRTDPSAITAIIDAHPITSSHRHWWSTKKDLTCACGWSCRVVSKFSGWMEANHWAAVGGIPMWRTLEDIHAGR